MSSSAAMASSASSNSPLRILILGATGTLGTHIVNGLLADQHKDKMQLTALVRPLQADSPASKREAQSSLEKRGVKLLHGDVTQSVAELTDLFRGQDVVLCVLGEQHLGEGEARVLEATKAAGVRWFCPSEWGYDLDKEGKGGALAPLYDRKIELREATRQSGLDYTFFNSGVFGEAVVNPFNGVDAATRTITFPGSGDARCTATTLAGIGVLTADAIVSGRGRNKTLFFGGATFSYTELAELLERLTGASWKRVIRSAADCEAAIAANPDDLPSRVQLLLAQSRSTHWPLENTYNVQQGISVQSLEDMVRASLKRQQQQEQKQQSQA